MSVRTASFIGPHLTVIRGRESHPYVFSGWRAADGRQAAAGKLLTARFDLEVCSNESIGR